MIKRKEDCIDSIVSIKDTKKSQIIAWCLVVCWMLVIFFFSAQPAERSNEMSGFFQNNIVGFAERLSLNFLLPSLSVLHTLIRKGAHLLEYMFLGLLIYRAYYISGFKSKHGILFAQLSCTLYAISDEIHQIFVPGRSNQIKDVIIDSIGAGIGILIFYIAFIKSKKANR